jgi:excisionase family DNA binding protein
MSDLPLLLSPAEAGRHLGLSHVTVRQWIRDGRIKAIRSGRSFKIPRSELDKLDLASPNTEFKELIRQARELHAQLAVVLAKLEG